MQAPAAHLKEHLADRSQVVARRGGSASQKGRWKGMDADQDMSDDQVRRQGAGPHSTGLAGGRARSGARF